MSRPFFPEPPVYSTPLGYHRVLAPTAGAKVSPLCLGGMNFGDAWKAYMGECSKEQSFEVMDAFVEAGGNFIDTANNYQNEESETWIGEWMAKKKNREQLFIATKYTTGFRNHNRDTTEPLQSNFVGNSMKSMRTSVEHSLKKLQTDYIDLLYLHWWDFTTSIPEVMNGLNNLVTSGKVLYLGISDTPAFIVSKANEYARQNGLRPFSVYQGKWNAGFRDIEREILWMCREEGMAIAPWGALGQGKLKTKEAREAAEGSPRGADMSGHDVKISEALEDVGKKKGASLQAVALAYVMHKHPYVFPIIGQRSAKHVQANIEALKISLSEDDIDEIEHAAPFDVGFPMNFLFREYKSTNTAPDVFLTNMTAQIDVPGHLKAPGPRKT
ncbi:norsolorinic acid reductase [Aulographum hederae CBS 113979]|uniref:Norsolorinic acid reductase n=1 Tax=Aulographum hederae CBS 113979 TaxID=1176131 RepID=A0A6G1HH49_9PEZI|nr:norsolorinic acid reductase [Aulographum hederae CBS 113979]